ncbi:MAG: hypothetical protein ABSE73_20315 [Planctomycetota bacterium]
MSAQDANPGKLVDANLVATHAYQVLLAQKAAGKVEENCWSDGGLPARELEALVAHQKALLSTPLEELKTWASGADSTFDPAKDLNPLLECALRPADPRLPVNVLAGWLRDSRALASLLQMMLDIERDGDLLQDMYRVYHALGLPVHFGQIGITAAGDEEFLEVGKELSPRMCASPFATDPATLQMLLHKMYNWGRRYTGERNKTVLAKELLAEADSAALVPLIRCMPAEKIAVIGHSFTMDVNWASPSAFVPIVAEIFKALNPRVEIRQWAQGGLTASRACNALRFHDEVLAWKPHRVLLVVAVRTEEDDEALEKMGRAFARAGVKAATFDGLTPAPERFAYDTERASGSGAVSIIEVRRRLAEAPDRDKFLSLDGIHMTEPYHRLMAKEWLKYLLGL